MSVAAGGGSESAVDPKITIGIGIIGGLIGVYLTPFHSVLGPLLASLGAVCAIIWGADAIAGSQLRFRYRGTLHRIHVRCSGSYRCLIRSSRWSNAG